MSGTILATCGGWAPSDRADLEFSPLQHYAVELAGVTGRAPRMGILGTAGGDQLHLEANELRAARLAGVDAQHIRLFGRRDEDLRELVLALDVVWVNGGSVVNLLALWRAHGLDAVLREAWAAGVVLAGTSAGALCWHSGGPTSSFGPALCIEADALGLLPHSLAVHYDSQPRRRPLFHKAVGDGILPDGYAVDEGVGLLYRASQLVEVVTENPAGSAYRVSRTSAGVREEPLPARRL